MKFTVVFTLSSLIALILTLTTITTLPVPSPVPYPLPKPVIYDRLLGKLAVPVVIAGGYAATAAVGGVAGALTARLHRNDHGGRDHWGIHDGLEHVGVGHHASW